MSTAYAVLACLAAASALACGAVALMAVSMARQLRGMSRAVAELAAMTEPLAANVERATTAALAEISRAGRAAAGAEEAMARLDETLEISASLQRRLEDASRLAVAAVGAPLVKVAAARAGTASAWRRLKRKGGV